MAAVSYKETAPVYFIQTSFYSFLNHSVISISLKAASNVDKYGMRLECQNDLEMVEMKLSRIGYLDGMTE